MKQGIFSIIENQPLVEGVMKMKLAGDTDQIKKPGQFVNIKLDGLFLRRPISVCDLEKNILTIIYKVVGRGTKHMALMKKGEQLDVLTGLGNGYDLAKAGDRPVLIGGGAGVPPMYYLAKELLKQDSKAKVKVILGFNTASEVFYEDEFKALGAETLVTTVDGSYGIGGFVTDALTLNIDSKDIDSKDIASKDITYFFACGPEPMLRAVCKATDEQGISGQLSFEERMGCGFGACMGCSCKTLYGNKRICKEGPVLAKEEILWQN